MVDEFISDVCDILDIPIPIISFDTSNFTSNTMMAQCNSDGTVIYIKEKQTPNPDYFFSSAHELRHIWQILNDSTFYLQHYKTRIECNNLDEYNLQIAELDANAFAGLIMIDFFKIKPLFTDSSTLVVSKIFERMDLISKDFA